MLENDKVREKKVAAAVNALMWFTGMKVHEAMDYARFSKKDINDVNICCTALTLASYNGDVMKLSLKPAASTRVVTVAHSQARIELLSQAKSHGNIYAATGGDHLTSNDMFQSIALKQQKILREKLAKDKKVRERLKRTEFNALGIIQRRGGDPSKLTSGDLTTLFTWHRVPKVGELNKEEKLAKWGRIMTSMKLPPSYEKWTNKDEVKLEEAQSDDVKMAHTALGHMVVPMKKELLLLRVRCRRRSSINWWRK
jgi:hypothetical protein